MASGTLWGNTVQGVWRCYAKWSDSSTNTTFTMNMTTGMRSLAYGFNIHNLYADSSINNSTNYTNTASFYSATGATVDKDFVSKSVTVNRTHSTQTIHAHASVVNNTGFKNGRSDIYTSWTVPAKPSYTVSYNANGGSGAPGNQTKWYGETLTLSSTKPSRTGHSFQGWATSSGGSVAYASGANYTGNAALTLYAVWKANTYAVKYNANGGSGAPGQQTKTYGVTLKLSSTKPTRTNYNFKGWATSATGAVAYQPGANYTANAAVTLYAIWEIAYIKPRITNLSADRCNSAGTLAEDGQYAKVTFNWATDKTVSSIQITCNGATTNVSGSGTSGSVTKVVGDGSLNTEYSYTVTVKVADSMGSSTQGQTVTPLNYIIDFSPQGGVGVGVPAPNSKEFQVVTPLITTTRLTGFMNRGYHGNSTTWYWKTLARAQVTTSDLVGGGSITVRGVLGGFGGSTSGTVDITVAIREPSATTLIVDKFGPALFNNGCAAIIFKIDYSGYLTLYVATCGYYSYNLFVEADRQVDIIDSSWFTGEPAGTTLINTRYVKTDQFGGYPAKLEKLNGYFGFALPDKTRNEWMRTTYNGLIPYQQGGASALGTSTWPFNTVWVNQLNWTGSGLKGRVMKQIWSGTWSSGSITVSELPYYNVFTLEAYVNSAYHKMFIGVITPSRNNIAFGVLGGSMAGTEIYALNVEVSGTSFNVTRNTWFNPEGGVYTNNAIKIVKIFGVL